LNHQTDGQVCRRLEGRVAIVTGGSRGIGRGIALELAREGAAVVVNHVAAHDAAKDVVAEIENMGGQAMAFSADVGDREAGERLVHATVERFGKLDILVNNAGICPFRDFLDIDDEVWDQTVRTNLYGPFALSQSASRAMAERGSGSIIHISSVSSYIGSATQVHYCATKGGINAMTAAMAVALGPLGIRVNAVLPGGVPTDINRHQWEGRSDQAPGLPVNRIGRPMDIARAVCYLASDDAEWVTGVLLPVDGGVTVSR
jgi:NAD(P)-dependent dehydrogenase (short-subunit alcohol dehydrogenase family)